MEHEPTGHAARATAAQPDEAAIRAITRPHKSLLVMYTLQALAGLFLFPVIFVPLFFRYHTLRYAFDDEGVSASWGILFRREIYLTYRRIQDIHVSRNVFERWLGIGKVEIQTASGSASAELSVEGMRDYEAVRDYLYRRMRGTQDRGAGAARGASGDATAAAGGEAEVLRLLREIQSELEGARRALEQRG